MNNSAVPLIEIVDLSKTYQSKSETIEVLSEASLQVFPGEIISVVGASGVGKSTLLHIMGGLDRPTAGKVLFLGNSIFEQKNGFLEEFRNQHIGFVFQSFNLMLDFTALENAMFPALISHTDKKQAREKAEHLLCQMGLKDRLQHRPGELSGGECQRVALARGLINQPDILLADEPTGNLDSHSSDSLMELIYGLNREFNQTFVIVTHSQRIARRTGRVLQLTKGKINPIDKEIVI